MQKQPRITINESCHVFYIDLAVAKAPLFARIVLGLLLLISVLLPALILVVMAASDKGIKLGAVIGMLVAFAISVFFARLLLWNTYGKETIVISKDAVDYCCDYKYFRDRRLRLEGGPFAYGYILTDSKEVMQTQLDEIASEGEGKLIIRAASGDIVSHIAFPTEELRRAIAELTLEN